MNCIKLVIHDAVYVVHFSHFPHFVRWNSERCEMKQFQRHLMLWSRIDLLCVSVNACNMYNKLIFQDKTVPQPRPPFLTPITSDVFKWILLFKSISSHSISFIRIHDFFNFLSASSHECNKFSIEFYYIFYYLYLKKKLDFNYNEIHASIMFIGHFCILIAVWIKWSTT